MKIKIIDLHKCIGNSIIITQSDIPDGTYLVMDFEKNINSYIYDLYNIKTENIERSSLEDITEVIKLTTSFEINVELMEEALVKKILILSNDKFDLEDKLNPYIQRLSIIREIKNVINK